MKSFFTITLLTLTMFYGKAQSWVTANSNAMNNDTYGLQVRNDTVIVSGLGILSVSLDNGNNWSSKIAGLPANPFVRDVLWVNNKLFVTILYAGIWVSNDFGQNWQLFDGTSIPNNGPTEMGTDGTSLFVADLSGNLWKSSLNSANFTKVLTVSGAVTDIAVDANDKIYVGSVLNGVYTSSNNGNSFTQISTGLPSIAANLYSEVQSVASNGNGDIYCSVNNKGVFKYNTSSNAWEAKNNGIEEIANNVGTAYRGLLAFGNTVLLGTANGNVYLSNNSGDTFTNIAEDELVPTYKIAISSSKIFVSRYSVKYRGSAGLFNSAAANEAFAAHPISLFPNPAQDLLNVQIGDLHEAATVVVVDYSGRTVLTKQISAGGEFSLDVSGLSKGFYLVQAVVGGETIASKKFLKK